MTEKLKIKTTTIATTNMKEMEKVTTRKSTGV